MKDDLIKMIDGFLHQNDMKPTRFSRLCVGNPNFVRNLKLGCDIRLSTVKRVRDFISNYDTPEKEGE